MMLRAVFLLLVLLGTLRGDPFVTYEFSGGRFGDCLLAYLHAKWLSYKYDLPLLYKPFQYSDELCLHGKERPFIQFYPVQLLGRIQLDPSRNRTIFSCPYFPEDPSDRWINPRRYRFDVDWKDQEFKRIAREMIAPKSALQMTIPPKNSVNVAIHIREGGGYDTDHTRLWDPLKLPPIHFYQEGLKKVIELFKGKAIYCFLFTDALEPSLLAAELYQSIPPELGVQIDYRIENNNHSANVLEDFFSFFNFDVLIHPQSNYSVVAAGIGDFALTYSPVNFKREEKTITITEAKLDRDDALFKQVLERVGS